MILFSNVVTDFIVFTFVTCQSKKFKIKEESMKIHYRVKTMTSASLK